MTPFTVCAVDTDCAFWPILTLCGRSHIPSPSIFSIFTSFRFKSWRRRITPTLSHSPWASESSKQCTKRAVNQQSAKSIHFQIDSKLQRLDNGLTHSVRSSYCHRHSHFDPQIPLLSVLGTLHNVGHCTISEDELSFYSIVPLHVHFHHFHYHQILPFSRYHIGGQIGPETDRQSGCICNYRPAPSAVHISNALDYKLVSRPFVVEMASLVKTANPHSPCPVPLWFSSFGSEHDINAFPTTTSRLRLTLKVQAVWTSTLHQIQITESESEWSGHWETQRAETYRFRLGQRQFGGDILCNRQSTKWNKSSVLWIQRNRVHFGRFNGILLMTEFDSLYTLWFSEIRSVTLWVQRSEDIQCVDIEHTNGVKPFLFCRSSRCAATRWLADTLFISFSDSDFVDDSTQWIQWRDSVNGFSEEI